MPRRCTGGPGEERLWLVDWGLFSSGFLASSGFLRRSLGKRWAERSAEEEGDEISIIAPRRPQDETFPRRNSFRNSICKGCGEESVGWWLLSEWRPRNLTSK